MNILKFIFIIYVGVVLYCFIKDLYKLYKPYKSKNNKYNKLSNDLNEMSFNDVSIGGLDYVFNILRTHIILPLSLSIDSYKDLGLEIEKGIILYGPPGTGKTTIIKNLGKLIDANVTLISSASLIGRYVGHTENNIKDIFDNAKDDYESTGRWQIVCFDEIDIICKNRDNEGSSYSTIMSNNSTTQLLCILDGVEELDHIIVFGTTNKLDNIDNAIKRPGRLGIHIEIKLPDEYERRKIFEIYTRKMSKLNKLSDDVNFYELSKITDGLSGADIKQIVRNTGLYAIEESHELNTPLLITMEHLKNQIHIFIS